MKLEHLTERERLIKLLNHEFGTEVSEIVADYLLANGVTMPPCKVGDMVYLDLFADYYGGGMSLIGQTKKNVT